MVSKRHKLILWVGKKHSGKTTNVANLAEVARNEGFDVAGLLALSLYRDGRLIGFDAFDLRSKDRAPLARRQTNGCAVGPFTFLAAGLELGRTALRPESTSSADLIIVDEFGPWELDGGGWRTNVDELLAAGNGLVLLVVRDQLVSLVQRIYSHVPITTLAAGGADSIGRVIELLRSRHQAAREVR